jgi:hypothetical protein
MRLKNYVKFELQIFKNIWTKRSLPDFLYQLILSWKTCLKLNLAFRISGKKLSLADETERGCCNKSHNVSQKTSHN